MPRPLSRRSLLRGSGVALALPLLDAMMPRRAAAASAPLQNFVALFMPNGVELDRWQPPAGVTLAPERLPSALEDFAGFDAERIWPAAGPVFSDITVVSDVDHHNVTPNIHYPSFSLSAHRESAQGGDAPARPTLDQVLAERIGGQTPFRTLTLASHPHAQVNQGFISFREGGQVETPIREPSALYSLMLGAQGPGAPGGGASDALTRRRGVLDRVLDDAHRLDARLGAADRARMEQYLESIRELERQFESAADSCESLPDEPEHEGDRHANSRSFIDLLVLALTCGMTRVATLQYSNSWNLDYRDYGLGEGLTALGSYDDHSISHKLGNDRTPDLDELPGDQRQAVANERTLITSRFKARRFANLVDRLKQVSTPTGTLLDRSLVLYVSECGNGNHHRRNMPFLLAGGRECGLQTGRVVSAGGAPTGSLHATILSMFGESVDEYGDPSGSPLTELFRPR